MAVSLKDLQATLDTAQAQLAELMAVQPSNPGQPESGTLAFLGSNMGLMNNNSNVLPGVEGQHYRKWVKELLAKRVATGMPFCRAPMSWERFQVSRGMPFAYSVNKKYVGEWHDNYAMAEEVGLQVVPDLHNYMRFKGQLISNDPNSAQPSLPDFWVKWWSEYGQHKCFWGLGLMNEPHDMSDQVLFDTIQATVTALRNAGCKLPLLIPANNWCSGSTYQTTGAFMLKIQDPLNNLFFEVHNYLMEGGMYTAKSVTTSFDKDAFIRLFTPAYTEILKAGKRMLIGEFAWPKGNKSAEQAGVELIKWAYSKGIPMFWWADGFGWPASDLIALYNDNGKETYVESNNVRSLLDVLEPWFAKRLTQFM